MPSRMPRTSYGTIGEDYYEKLEETFGTHNINKQNDNNNNNKQFSACGKSMIAAVILVFISLAAVSISEFAIPSSNTKSIKLDSVSRPIFATLQDYEKEALFRVFVDDYGKMYKTDEYQTKLTNFKNFLELCDSRNMAEAVVASTAVHGVTMFADLTPSEFATYLGFVQSSTTSYGELIDSDKITTYDGTESTVDWTDIYTTSVRTQGYCGSCWAFSAVQQIESDTIRIIGTPYTTTSTLSVQQLVSCDSTSSGCSGGDSRMGYEYVMETGGLNMETNYPYTSYYDFAGSCDKTKSGYSIAVAQYYTITGADATTVETNMINYVKSTGPLSVCVDASEWSTYVSGTVAVCSTSPNHCVQIVGVNTDEGYWKIRNSWGTSWGEDGYIKLQLNADTCAITTVPTYTYTYLYGTTLSPTATPTTPYPSFEPTTASPTVEPTTEAPSFEPTAAVEEEVEEEEEDEDEEEDEETDSEDEEEEETESSDADEDEEEEEEESDSEEITEDTEDAEEAEDEEEEAETVEEAVEEEEEAVEEEEEAVEEEEEVVEEEEEADEEEEANSSKRGSSKKSKKSSKKSSK